MTQVPGIDKLLAYLASLYSQQNIKKYERPMSPGLTLPTYPGVQSQRPAAGQRAVMDPSTLLNIFRRLSNPSRKP